MRMSKERAREFIEDCVEYLGCKCYCQQPLSKIINREFEGEDFDGTIKTFGTLIACCDTDTCDFHLAVNYEVKD